MKLPLSFYERTDVVSIAKELIGKFLFTSINGELTGGIITETEAYKGEIDRASHAFGGRRTTRTEIMYGEPGCAYVYLCYGIHSLFNIVTNKKDIPHAVLIRAIYPTVGIEEIISRRKIKSTKINSLCDGPGTVSQALGIHYSDSGISLLKNKIWLEDKEFKIPKALITSGPRIGVNYAGADALLPYRFKASHVDISQLF